MFFLDKAFEMYVWGCVLREAYYFFLWFFNRQAKKENDIWRFFKKYAKVSFTFMYIVSLSAFRLERRSFDFSKFIFTCKYVKLYKLYFYLNWLHCEIIFTGKQFKLWKWKEMGKDSNFRMNEMGPKTMIIMVKTLTEDPLIDCSKSWCLDELTSTWCKSLQFLHFKSKLCFLLPWGPF